MMKLIQNPEVSVLNPLAFFLRRAAFFCSSVVLATAPMSASFVPMNALYSLLKIEYHAVDAMVVWDTIKMILPGFKRIVEQILEEEFT